MLTWLKKLFIPHIDNAYRPHFLLGPNMRHLLAIVVGFEMVLFILPTFNFTQYFDDLNLGAVLPGVLSTLTNEERAHNNLPELIENPVLSRAAQMKAEDMASKGYFAHTSPEGKTPWYWLGQAGYTYAFAGENLAVNFTDSEEVTQAWMDSPTHKANIIGRNYTEVGTGIATGVYKGKETVFVAQVYAAPVVQVAVASKAPVQSAPKSAPKPQSKPIVAQSAPVVTEEVVLGEATPTPVVAPAEPTIVQELLSSPKQSANAVLYVVLAIVLIAVFLNIVIKFEKQHPDLITNGLAVAVILFAIHLGNGYLAQKSLETSFIAFESTQVVVE